MELHTKRKPNGEHALLRDGVEVGRVWKYPTRPGFGLSLKGIYWITSGPTRNGGATGTSTKTLKAAVAKAKETFDLLGPPGSAAAPN